MLLEVNKNKMKKVIFYCSALLFVLWQSGGDFVSANNQKRIQFQINTIAEKSGERQILLQTSVEGPSGTDFTVNLQTGNFKMQARFLTDLVSSDRLRLRANLNTRRFYGSSPNNLPLYEEDEQKKSLEIGFTETVVLLPFGRNGSDETLKIEIVPNLSDVSEKTEKDSLQIKFDKELSSGEIYIEANKVPHLYEVEAVLLADGKEIAKGKSECLFEEEKEINLQAIGDSGFSAFTAKVTISEFNYSRPNDLVGMRFDLNEKKSDGEISSIVNNGGGKGRLNEEFIYSLNGGILPKGKNYELRFKINLAQEEK